jgi:hypothetical protein
MALSPGMVFYGRYAIHESWLVLFQMLTMWGLLRLWQDGSRRGLWAVGMGVAGLILTKETWIIHGIAVALAVPTLWILEKWSPSAPGPIAARKWTMNDAGNVAAASLGAIVFFYSACLLDPASLRGILDAYAIWTDTGMTSASGHEKSWSYWLQLMSIYEWTALIGLAASVALMWPHTNRQARFLAITGAGAFAGYCLVPYKTPWCLISMIWPFFFFFGQAVEWTRYHVDRWICGLGAGLVCAFSLSASVDLNFRQYAGSDDQPDWAEPYVYVQTTTDLELLLGPLRWLEKVDPMALHRPAHVIMPEHHPFRWLLGDYTRITWDEADGNPEPMDATWLFVDATAVDRIEDALQQDYFKTPLRIRGMAPDTQMLYFDAETFRPYFPGREPEFVSAEGELLRELEEEKAGR